MECPVIALRSRDQTIELIANERYGLPFDILSQYPVALCILARASSSC
jgi:hypothetical protein